MKFGKAKASITETLTDTFGITFLKATTDQKLALIECTAFLMRQSNYCLQDAIIIVVTPEVQMPPVVECCTLHLENFREGLTLLALLYGAVNRDCEVALED
jgi:hypothetical protein